MKIERKESGGNWREAEERVVRKARKLGKTRKGRVFREGRVRRERGNIVAVICRTVSKQEESTNLAPFFPLCLSRPEQNESEVNPPRCKTHRPITMAFFSLRGEILACAFAVSILKTGATRAPTIMGAD